jgi:lipopolysaccharide export system permease protein
MSSLLMPLYTLIAVVFFTSRLAFNSEILSILNAGVSFGRLLRPYLIGGATIGLMHLSINHFIAPGFNKWKLWFERTYVWKQQDKGKTTNVHLLTAPDVKVYIRGYNKNGKSMSGLRVERFEGSQIKSILSAENARWKSETRPLGTDPVVNQDVRRTERNAAAGHDAAGYGVKYSSAGFRLLPQPE